MVKNENKNMSLAVDEVDDIIKLNKLKMFKKKNSTKFENYWDAHAARKIFVTRIFGKWKTIHYSVENVTIW